MSRSGWPKVDQPFPALRHAPGGTRAGGVVQDEAEFLDGYPADPMDVLHAALVTGLRDCVGKRRDFPGSSDEASRAPTRSSTRSCT